MRLTAAEQNNRERLQNKKPLVYNKVITHADKIKNGESVAVVQLQYRYDCNFTCKHCAIEKLKGKPGGTLITIKDVARIGNELDDLGIASICVSGGEPIMFPDLPDVIEALDPRRFHIGMDTNGWLLTQEKIRYIQSLGIDRIQLSMDNLHNDGSKPRAIKTLEMCQNEGLRVIINVVVTKSLIAHGLESQLAYLSTFGEHINLIAAKPVGSFEDSRDEILDGKDFEYVQSIVNSAPPGSMSTHQSPNFGYSFGCFAFKRLFSITAYGDVMPCPWIPISMGNIHSENLKDIVNRGLDNKWFGYGSKQSCLAGNKDTPFFKKIIPQIEKAKEYPAKWTDIEWY